MPWWMENNLRLIQCNLRDIDGAMDVDRLISDMKDFHANALMVGAGGITSFFPTELPYQTPSPYLCGDKLGELVEKGHAAGLRIIARFDFSKTHERLFAENPNWYYRSAAGNALRYNDTVQTCVNGEYQRELSLEIIAEVLHKYPVDGIFFNMFGYQTRDYSGNYHGICHCDGCARLFRERYGLDLPASEDASEPALASYRIFQEQTVREMLDRIADHTKAINPEVAICTYHHHRVDIIRDESNSAVDRPYPIWLYSASENCQSVEDTFPDKTSSNVAINAVDIFYRFQGVSPHLTKMRLVQNIASGSGLDWCIIGVFDGYPDRAAYDAAREVFAFHEKHERHYGHRESIADIALIKPYRSGNREYLGLFKMLKEAHIPFAAVSLANPDAVAAAAKRCRTILIPGIPDLPQAVMDALHTGGAHLIATGNALAEDPKWLRTLFGVEIRGPLSPIRSAYLSTEPKELFSSFPGRDWVYLDGDFSLLALEGAKGSLPLVAPAMFGPPERCFGHEVMEDRPGVALYEPLGRRCAFFPWSPGALYYKHGYEDHKQLFLDVLKNVHGAPYPVETNAPPCVEVFLDKIGEKQYMLQLINLSGFNGTTFAKPLPIYDIVATVRLPCPIAEIEALHENAVFRVDGNSIAIERLDEYQSYIITIA